MEAWETIQRTVDWIEAHLGEELSLSRLAGIAHLSPSYFQRLFKRLVGKPVMEYVKLRRLARASNRLVFNRHKVVEACYHYGFGCHETFSRAFKAQYGVTPRQYRRFAEALPHYSMPLLTEKGHYRMDYNVHIQELGELRYLAIRHMVSMNDDDDSIAASKKLWEQCMEDGSLRRLKEACGADKVYALFCNLYDQAANVVTYDFACPDPGNADSGEFTSVTLRPAKYAVFTCTCKPPMTQDRAYRKLIDIFWGEWLPKTDYKSVIDYDWSGNAASIELYTPLECTAEGYDGGQFSCKIWYPIEDK